MMVRNLTRFIWVALLSMVFVACRGSDRYTIGIRTLSPSGNFIAFEEKNGSINRLSVYNRLDGESQMIRETNDSFIDVVFSPDERHLVYSTGDSYNSEWYLARFGLPGDESYYVDLGKNLRKVYFLPDGQLLLLQGKEGDSSCTSSLSVIPNLFIPEERDDTSLIDYELRIFTPVQTTDELGILANLFGQGSRGSFLANRYPTGSKWLLVTTDNRILILEAQKGQPLSILPIAESTTDLLQAHDQKLAEAINQARAKQGTPEADQDLYVNLFCSNYAVAYLTGEGQYIIIQTYTPTDIEKGTAKILLYAKNLADEDPPREIISTGEMNQLYYSEAITFKISPRGHRLLLLHGKPDEKNVMQYTLFLKNLEDDPGILQELSRTQGWRPEYAFSPDGRQFIYQGESNDGSRFLYLERANGEGSYQIPSSNIEQFYWLETSP